MGEDGKVTYCNNGPCYGECGNGDRFRTQGVPKKSKELDYVHVMQVWEKGWKCREILRVFLSGWDRGQLCCLRHQRHRGGRCWGDRGVRDVGPSQDRIHWVIISGPDSMYNFTPWCMLGPEARGTKHCWKRWSFHMFYQPTHYQYYLEIIFRNCTTPWYFIQYLRSYLYMEVRLSLEHFRWTKIILILICV